MHIILRVAYLSVVSAWQWLIGYKMATNVYLSPRPSTYELLLNWISQIFAVKWQKVSTLQQLKSLWL